MITGRQIRAARAALRWNASTLADKANVGIQTVKRLEGVDGIPPSRSSTLNDLKKALEAAGVEFIGGPDDAPGVRFRGHQAPQDDAIRGK